MLAKDRILLIFACFLAACQAPQPAPTPRPSVSTMPQPSASATSQPALRPTPQPMPSISSYPVEIVAGSGLKGFQDGPALQASFNAPTKPCIAATTAAKTCAARTPVPSRADPGITVAIILPA